MKKKSLLIVLLLIITNLISFTAGKSSIIGLKNTINSVAMKNGSDVSEEQKSVQDKKREMVRSYVKENYLKEVTDEELFEGQLKGMVSILNDPYSEYMNQQEFQKLTEDLSGKFNGIGVVISATDDNYITVVSPIDDSPAKKAGIMTGDKIIKVDGKELAGNDINKATSMIKGDKGTKVKITVRRFSADKKNFNDIDFDITRDQIVIKTVTSKLLDNKIGYIRLSQFDEDSFTEFKEHMESLKSQGAKGIVLDLRNNPGGLLSTCTKIADFLLGKGVIVYTERRGGVRDMTYNSDDKMFDLPMVVLINEGSASASEILSGAIRDHERAKLIGEKSFGKGVVQNINPFYDGTGIKLTESEYFTPKGTKINKIGITPDIVVKLNEGVKVIGLENLKEDNQLQRAIEEVSKIIK